MSSASKKEQKVVPVFRLPDDVLMKICSYITSIKQKMELEQISQQFNRVSSNSTTWNGIHYLELMIKCQDKNQYNIFNTSCDRKNIHLNGVRVHYNKFPSAINSFLHRTELRQFSIHYGYDIDVAPDRDSHIALFGALSNVFDQNRAKIKIESLEFHGIMDPHPDSVEILGFNNFFHDLFQSSVPYLQELWYFTHRWNDLFGSSVWKIIQKFDKLKAFRGIYLEHCFGALLGKPLTEIALPESSINAKNAQELVNVINNVSSDGVESLTVQSDDLNGFIDYLRNHLTENSTTKLKSLFVTSHTHALDVGCLFVIPLIFPNMEKFDMQYVKLRSSDIDDFFEEIESFLDLTHDGSVTRRFTLQNLHVRKTEEDFREEITSFCHNADIDIDFGEMKPTPYVHLSKGIASYTIWNLVKKGVVVIDSDSDEEETDEDYTDSDEHTESGSDEKSNENTSDSTNGDEIGLADVDQIDHNLLMYVIMLNLGDNSDDSEDGNDDVD